MLGECEWRDAAYLVEEVGQFDDCRLADAMKV